MFLFVNAVQVKTDLGYRHIFPGVFGGVREFLYI